MTGRPSSKENCIVLVTGCSSGIGRCVALGLHERGYRVFASVRTQQDKEELSKLGLTVVMMDLTDSDSINSAVEEVLAQTGGRIHVLFNNAAYGQPGAVEDLRRDVIRKQFETNLFGPLELTNRVIPVMRAQGYGRIIQNSSVLGLAAMRFRGAYNSSKFALEGLTDTLRQELVGSGVCVSLIEPGPITSNFRRNAMKAFMTNIDHKNSAHAKVYEGVIKRLTKPGPAQPFTLGPEAVLKRVLHAIESGRPRIRYYVTFPTYLFATLRRILSYRALDRILLKASGNENR